VKFLLEVRLESDIALDHDETASTEAVAEQAIDTFFVDLAALKNVL
jgi:hypothetical protein